MSAPDIVLPDDAPLSYPEPPTELQQALQLYKPIPASFLVTSDGEYAVAGEILKQRIGMRKLIVDFFAPLKDAANKAHKALTKAEKEKLDPVALDETYLKRAMALYKTEVEAKAKEAAAAAEAILRKQAEDRQLAEAATLEKMGQKAAAEAVLNAPVVVPVLAPVVVAPKVEGVSYSTTWKAEINDMRAFVLHVAANIDALGNLLLANESALNAFARSSKGNLPIPGVRFYAETGVRGRA